MSFTCPVCGVVSHNPNDEREGYCGNCHEWTGPLPWWCTAITRCLDCGEFYVGRPTCGGAFEVIAL